MKITGEQHKQMIYCIKCVTGAAICYLLYITFPKYPMYWSLVSVVLVFSPDVDNNQLAFGRIKANILGSGVALSLLAIHIPELLKISIGILLTITVNYILKLTDATRSALAALIIVIIQEQHSGSYLVALQRAACVLVGCCVALLITMTASLVKRAGVK